MKPLTREQTEGTLTFFFPRVRTGTRPPEVTLMVSRAGDEWVAGLAMCSRQDNFQKRIGRWIAYHRLLKRPLRDKSPTGLLLQVLGRVQEVDNRQESLYSATTFSEIPRLSERLQDMRVG